MSFQFSPETLILEVDRRILQVQNQVEKKEEELFDLRARIARGQRAGGFGNPTVTTDNNFFALQIDRTRRELPREISILNQQITAFENEKFLLRAEADLRMEQLEPIQPIQETIQPIQITPEQKNGINLKTLAIIGAVILLLG